MNRIFSLSIECRCGSFAIVLLIVHYLFKIITDT